MREHWFWWLLTAATLVWYCTITVYVAIRGAMDIKHMLRRLQEEQDKAAGGAAAASSSADSARG